MSNREWNEYKAHRAEVLSRYHRMRGELALSALFALYACQYRERGDNP